MSAPTLPNFWAIPPVAGSCADRFIALVGNSGNGRPVRRAVHLRPAADSFSRSRQSRRLQLAFDAELSPERASAAYVIRHVAVWRCGVCMAACGPENASPKLSLWLAAPWS